MDLDSVAIRWVRKEIVVGAKFKEPIVEGVKYVTVVRMAQSVRLTGWTVRGSNPGGDEIFPTCADRS